MALRRGFYRDIRARYRTKNVSTPFMLAMRFTVNDDDYNDSHQVQRDHQGAYLYQSNKGFSLKNSNEDTLPLRHNYP